MIEMGGIEQTKEKCREARGMNWVLDFAQDVRYGIRMLRRTPGFTIVAILILGLAIAGNTTVFSAVDAFVLRQPPVREPERVVVVSSVDPANGWAADRAAVSARDYFAWRAQSTSFNSMAAAAFDHFTISGDGASPQWVAGARVSADFFNVVGVYPVLGRAIQPGENEAGHDQAIVLSNQLWQERFGGDPHAIGRSLNVNGNRYIVIGVMPRKFQLPGQFRAEFWVPLVPLRDNLFGSGRDARYLSVFARLKPRVTEGQAATEMQTIAQRLARAYPTTNRGWGANVRTLHQFEVADSGAQTALLFLSMAAGFLLLIACANLAGLLLARNTGRQRELSIRSALGASRLRLSRQILTECLLLAATGGGLGILLAIWGVSWLRSACNWNEDAIASAGALVIDAHVLIFTFAASLAAALLLGLLPAMRAARRDMGGGLRADGRTSSGGPRRTRLQQFLVAGQIALSLFLVIGAGLFVDGFVQEVRTSIGFNAHSLLTATIWLRGMEYFSPVRQRQFSERAQLRLAELPGVQSAALATDIPFDFPGEIHFTVEGHPVGNGAEEPSASYFAITPRYFATTEIPLLRGREFLPSDTASSPPVAIVNQAFASRFLDGRDPIGQHIRLDGRKQPSEVIGVVGDVREFLAQTDFRPELFVPLDQEPSSLLRAVVRTRTNDPASMADSVRQAIWAVDPNQAVTEVRTMDRVIADSGTGSDILVDMMGTFALLALFIAAIGVFGLLSYVVSQRTNEIGVRMALGSKPADILLLVLRRGMTLVVIGTGAGLFVGLALPKVIAAAFSQSGFGMLHSTLALTAGPIVLLAVGFAACWIPARRAMRMDPMVALRYE